MPKIVSPSGDKYPLLGSQLNVGKLYECDNGTFVIRVNSQELTRNHNKKVAETIINIANGVGGYSDNTQFRLLTETTIETSTDQYGNII